MFRFLGGPLDVCEQLTAPRLRGLPVFPASPGSLPSGWRSIWHVEGMLIEGPSSWQTASPLQRRRSPQPCCSVLTCTPPLHPKMFRTLDPDTLSTCPAARVPHGPPPYTCPSCSQVPGSSALNPTVVLLIPLCCFIDGVIPAESFSPGRRPVRGGAFALCSQTPRARTPASPLPGSPWRADRSDGSECRCGVW